MQSVKRFLFLVAVVTQGAWSAPSRYLAVRTDYPSVYDVKDFDWLTRLEVFRLFDGAGKFHTVEQAGRKFEIHWNAQVHEVSVQQSGRVLAKFELRPLVESLREGRSIVPQKTLTLEVSSPAGQARLYLEDISAEWPPDGALQLHHVKGDLLFREARSASRK